MDDFEKIIEALKEGGASKRSIKLAEVMAGNKKMVIDELLKLVNENRYLGTEEQTIAPKTESRIHSAIEGSVQQPEQDSGLKTSAFSKNEMRIVSGKANQLAGNAANPPKHKGKDNEENLDQKYIKRIEDAREIWKVELKKELDEKLKKEPKKDLKDIDYCASAIALYIVKLKRVEDRANGILGAVGTRKKTTKEFTSNDETPKETAQRLFGDYLKKMEAIIQEEAKAHVDQNMAKEIGKKNTVANYGLFFLNPLNGSKKMKKTPTFDVNSSKDPVGCNTRSTNKKTRKFRFFR
ncbi:hypothetical protein V1387_17875 [Allomuricauda taeanensis]|uniref:hypothetical protein n=1 Tax=Flagellimonas taeanensis TaxID=1005926 RepID=UPI002E7C5578|nr:hypothetical protein [Allomuricauda taeanensis]MEE1964562.1 hypothetical protein [Allomuricauda taeanensis]